MVLDFRLKDSATPTPNDYTLQVDSYVPALLRGPKTHERKSLPALGSKDPILTDFGNKQKQWQLAVVFDSWSEFKTLYDLMDTTFFANRPTFLVHHEGSVDEETLEGAPLSLIPKPIGNASGGDQKIEAALIFVQGDTFTLLGG